MLTTKTKSLRGKKSLAKNKPLRRFPDLHGRTGLTNILNARRMASRKETIEKWYRLRLGENNFDI